jgi:hypothetical protein
MTEGTQAINVTRVKTAIMKIEVLSNAVLRTNMTLIIKIGSKMTRIITPSKVLKNPSEQANHKTKKMTRRTTVKTNEDLKEIQEQ